EDALAAAERCQQAPVVALVEEEAGLVFGPRRHAEAHSVLGDDLRRRRFRLAAVKRLLLLNVFLSEPVEATALIVPRQGVLDRLPEAVHSRREELHYQHAAEAVDHQSA